MTDARGLCADCANARVVTSARGASFVLCGLSRIDEGFAKYPRLPVVTCAGFRAVERPADAQGHQR